MDKRPLSPGVLLEPVDGGGHRMTSPHSDMHLWELQLADAFGTRSASVMLTFMGMLKLLIPDTGGQGLDHNKPDETELNAALAMAADIQPRNVAEAALAAQMVAVHWMQMRLAAQALNRGYSIHEREAALAGKLARTYVMQLQTLAQLRGGKKTARQSIKVSKETHHHQHIHVHRGDDEHHGQPQATGAPSVAKLAALPGPDTKGRVVPISSRARQARVQDARGIKSGSTEG